MKHRRAAAPKRQPPSPRLDAATQATLDAALEKHRLGATDEAMEGYRKVLAVAPRQLDALMNLGGALTTLGKAGEALRHLRLGLEQAPDLPRVQNDAGVCFTELGRYDEAIAAFRRAVELAPGYAVAWKNLGRVLVDVGREAEAVPVLQQAVLIEPLLAEGWWELHRALFDPAQPRPAVEALTRAVAADPDFPFARFLLAVTLELAGDGRAAAQQLDVLRRAGVFGGAIESWRYVKEKRSPATRLFVSTRRALLFALEEAKLEGLSLELGVRYGISTRWIAEAEPARALHGFDSFQGLPEQWHIQPAGAYSTHGELPEVPPNVELHVGLFQDTLPAFAREHEGPIRFMNVDCDLYASTKIALDLLAGRIVPGTILVFDEYLVNDRWREDEYKAFQEAVADRGLRYEYLAFSLFTGQAVVKIIA